MPEHALTPESQPSASTCADRRAYVRVASDLAATCNAAGGRRLTGWPGRVKDISAGGIGLLLQHRFRPGTVLTIELRERTGQVLRTVQARVVHTTALRVDGGYCWLLGCSLKQPLTDAEFEALQ